MLYDPELLTVRSLIDYPHEFPYFVFIFVHIGQCETPQDSAPSFILRK